MGAWGKNVSLTRRFGRTGFLLWVGATILGVVIGQALSREIQLVYSGFPLDLVGLVILGVSTGIAQWHVLRRYLPYLSLSDWAIHTAIGVTVGWSVALIFGWGFRFTPFVLLPGALGGAILGLAQWRVLSGWARHSVWWVPAMSAAGAVTLAITYLPDSMPLNSERPGILAGVVISGVVLSWLMALTPTEEVAQTAAG